MPRDPEPTRRRILDAAYELFYRKGFARVGVDEVANFAGITKRTLYYHFESKDELLGAVLEHQHDLALARIRKQLDRRQARNAEQIISLLFAELAKWSAKPGWTGAGFTRLAMELADMPGHPARVAARRHKAAVEAWWTSVLGEAGVASPAERARELVPFFPVPRREIDGEFAPDSDTSGSPRRCRSWSSPTKRLATPGNKRIVRARQTTLNGSPC
jgi:AcrR family transcriptional regulator